MDIVSKAGSVCQSQLGLDIGKEGVGVSCLY
jgi:hypothetical protein